MNLQKYEMEMRRRARRNKWPHSPMSSVGSPLEIGQSSEPVGAEVCLVSSCSSQKISSIFSSFDQQKASVLKSIGFDGLLRIPPIENLNDHLTLWLYQRFDFKTMCLQLDGGVDLYIRDADVHLIFGIPFEGHRVQYALNQSKETLRDFQAKLSTQSTLSCLSLSFLEHILIKDYGSVMSAPQIDAFAAASVLVSMCYLLAPLEKHKFPTHLISNFVNDVKLGEMNWAQFVLWILGRAADDARSQLSSGSKEISMFGCSLLLQVFYIDNLNFGPSTPYHITLPRASAYSDGVISELIGSDIAGLSNDNLMLFGKREVRPAIDVCYTRGWKDHVNMKDDLPFPTLHDYLTSIEILSDGIRLVQNLGRHLNQFINICNYDREQPLDATKTSYLKFRSRIDDNFHNLSKKAANVMKRRNLSLYHHQILEDVPFTSENRILNGPPEQPVLKRTKCPVSGKPLDVTMLHQKSNNIGTSTGLHILYPDVAWKDKARCYEWMSNLSSHTDELNCDWIVFSKPIPLSIAGQVVQQCLEINGTFNVSIVDAIMLIWNYLDGKIYNNEKPHKRWRHFLPASFADIVNQGGEYLKSALVRGSFIGDHISYNVQECQKIIIPVLGKRQTWSCYFWDLKLKSITVLDPFLMNSSTTKVRENHHDTVFRLHSALFTCKDHFFPGWDIKPDGWTDIYLTDLARRCMPQNSGLFAVHYARSFCGSQIAFNLKNTNESNLTCARGEILYHIFTCAENQGYKPLDLVEKFAVDC